MSDIFVNPDDSAAERKSQYILWQEEQDRKIAAGLITPDEE